MNVSLQDISIRTELKAGDIGHVVLLHGLLYQREYGYGPAFESYVAGGLHEFHKNYDSTKDRVWICEYKGQIAGFMLLMHRENNSAQLRYFIIQPEFRGIGLGKKLLTLYFEFIKNCGYQSSWLWTTSDLHAAAALYTQFGFRLTEEIPSTAFGRPVTEQRYDWKAE